MTIAGAPETIEFSKIPRLFRECTITEKIDGTNGTIIIDPAQSRVWAQSKNQMLDHRSGIDNHGFDAWVQANADRLATLLGGDLDGISRHSGEWWGSGINRGYGLAKGEKRFSLFNTAKWSDIIYGGMDGLYCVPVLWEGVFSTAAVRECLDELATMGSAAAPGLMTT